MVAVLATMLCFFTVTALPAPAVAAEFHSTTASVNNNGSLTVNFDQRGLGEGNIDYTLTAHADATFACINGGYRPLAL